MEKFSNIIHTAVGFEQINKVLDENPWSKCSLRTMKEYLETNKFWCLLKPPTVTRWNLKQTVDIVHIPEEDHDNLNTGKYKDD